MLLAGRLNGTGVGAILGGCFLSPMLGAGTISDGCFSVAALGVSLLVAVILLAIVNLFRRGTARQSRFWPDLGRPGKARLSATGQCPEAAGIPRWDLPQDLLHPRPFSTAPHGWFGHSNRHLAPS
jgi:hypothetical protein